MKFPGDTVFPFLLLAAVSAPAVLPARAQLPAGPGRAETEKLCQACHEMAKSVSLRQDRNGWGNTLKKMMVLGMKAPDEDLHLVLAYLSKNFPAEELPPVDVNKARAIQLESRMSLRRSEAAAILRYRKEHGNFRSLEDLLKVPGIDAAKIEAKKHILVFAGAEPRRQEAAPSRE